MNNLYVRQTIEKSPAPVNKYSTAINVVQKVRCVIQHIVETNIYAGHVTMDSKFAHQLLSAH
jgi:hypothetical protein